MADGRSSLERAADYAESYGRISDEAVDLTVAENKEVNLRNLTRAQEKIDAGEAAQEVPAAITQRRQLEEARLMMTIEANRQLMARGYSIDTTELEALVEALKKLEQELNQKLFGDADAALQRGKQRFTRKCRQRFQRFRTFPRRCLYSMLTARKILRLTVYIRTARRLRMFMMRRGNPMRR